MKKIEIDTFLKFRFLSNPHFSPDGTKIAFTVSVPDREANGYLSDLYLYDLGKKAVSRVTCGGSTVRKELQIDRQKCSFIHGMPFLPVWWAIPLVYLLGGKCRRSQTV